MKKILLLLFFTPIIGWGQTYINNVIGYTHYNNALYLIDDNYTLIKNIDSIITYNKFESKFVDLKVYKKTLVFVIDNILYVTDLKSKRYNVYKIPEDFLKNEQQVLSYSIHSRNIYLSTATEIFTFSLKFKTFERLDINLDNTTLLEVDNTNVLIFTRLNDKYNLLLKDTLLINDNEIIPIDRETYYEFLVKNTQHKFTLNEIKDLSSNVYNFLKKECNYPRIVSFIDERTLLCWSEDKKLFIIKL